VRADTSDVVFRLLIALGELWDGLQRAEIEPSKKGLHMSKEYLGGYTRYSAGPAARSRLVFEWNESSRHLRILRHEAWPGFEALVSSTVGYVRSEARARGLSEVVDSKLLKACQEPPTPARRTIATTETAAATAAAIRRQPLAR